jgi:hypothetical protein
VDPRSSELTAADIARWRGCSRATAWRWLRDLEAEHGPTVVARRGKNGRYLYTTYAALAKVAPVPLDPNVERRLQDLEKRLADEERRSNAHARELSDLREFRRKAHAWLTRPRP